MNSVNHRPASDWNAIIKHTNTIGIDRQDLMKSLKACILVYLLHSKLKHKNSLQNIFFSLFSSELLSFGE